MTASFLLSGQLPDQRSGTNVTARPDEQFGAEQADLQFIVAVHGTAGIQRWRRSVHQCHSFLVAISAP